MLRYASIFLLLLLRLTALPQPDGRNNPVVLERFHDDALNITYFYPSRFARLPFPPATALTSGTRKCVQPTLFANSITPIDTSSFALSTVDNTCPDVLRFATQLGPFIRERIQSQLKQYGEPRIIQEPSSYTIDGHAAAITLASVIVPAPSGNVVRTISQPRPACWAAFQPGGVNSPNPPDPSVTLFASTSRPKTATCST